MSKNQLTRLPDDNRSGDCPNRYRQSITKDLTDKSESLIDKMGKLLYNNEYLKQKKAQQAKDIQAQKNAAIVAAKRKHRKHRGHGYGYGGYNQKVYSTEGTKAAIAALQKSLLDKTKKRTKHKKSRSRCGQRSVGCYQQPSPCYYPQQQQQSMMCYPQPPQMMISPQYYPQPPQMMMSPQYYQPPQMMMSPQYMSPPQYCPQPQYMSPQQMSPIFIIPPVCVSPTNQTSTSSTTTKTS